MLDCFVPRNDDDEAIRKVTNMARVANSRQRELEITNYKKKHINNYQPALKVPKMLFPFSSPYGGSPEGEGGLGI